LDKAHAFEYDRVMFKCPTIKAFKNAPDFFNEFYVINQPQMSHRIFADALQWPASLLGDIIQRRKPLSVNRAVEFGRYFNLHSVEIEHLIMLSLQEVNNPGVKDYAAEYLSTEGYAFPMSPTSPYIENSVEQEIHYYSEDLFADPEVRVLHAFLRWANGEVNLEDLPLFLPVHPSFKNKEHVLKVFAKMREAGLIEGEVPNVRVSKKNLVVEKFTGKYLEPFQEVYRRILQMTPEKTYMNNTTVVFPVAKTPELKSRMLALNTWAVMTAAREAPQGDGRWNEHTILHLEMGAYGTLTRADRTP
jgi:hypothetical protein